MSKIDDLAAAMIKAVGESSEAGEIVDWLDTGYPPLNMILSGHPDRGLPYGRIIEIFGPPSAGKTALACDLMISAQKAGGFAGFMDHEHALDVSLAKRNGLDTNPGKWLYKRPETWEASNTVALQAAELIRNGKFIDPKAPIIMVFDSVAAMIPKSMLYDSKGKLRELSEMTMNDTSALSRVSSTTLKLINKKASDLNIIVVYLNQIRTKIGVVYGDPTTTPGGSSFEFYASIRLALGKKMIKDADKEVTGQLIGITTKKNKVNRAFQETDVLLVYPEDGGASFDKTFSLLGALMEEGKIDRAGAYLIWEGKKYYARALADKIIAEDKYSELVKLYAAPKRVATAATAVAATATLVDALAAL